MPLRRSDLQESVRLLTLLADLMTMLSTRSLRTAAAIAISAAALALHSAAPAYAAKAPPAAPSRAEAQALPSIPGISAEALEKLRAQSVSGRFEEVKTVPGFPKPLVSSGIFSLRGGVLRWETQAPFASVMTISPAGIRFEAEGFESAPNASPASSRVSALLAGILCGNFSVLSELFELSGAEGPEGVIITAAPKDAQLAALISKIELRGRDVIERVDIAGAAAGGDRTVMRFSDVKAER